MSIYKHQWHEVYENRRIALQASDWTQMADSPLSDEKKAEWAAYRQALREMPSKWAENDDVDSTSPYDIPNLYPTRPSKS